MYSVHRNDTSDMRVVYILHVCLSGLKVLIWYPFASLPTHKRQEISVTSTIYFCIRNLSSDRTNRIDDNYILIYPCYSEWRNM